MQVINAKNKLNNVYMSQFLSLINPQEEIYVILPRDKSTVISVDALPQFFEKQEFSEEDIAKKEEMHLCTEEVDLIIYGNDYHWYNTERRRTKLFSTPNEQTSISTSTKTSTQAQLTVGIAYENSLGNLESSEEFSGSSRQCVEWLNKEYQLFSIRSFFKKQILINVGTGEWKKIEEFAKDGRIELK